MVRLKEEKVNQVKPKFFLFLFEERLMLSGRVLKFVNKFVTNSVQTEALLKRRSSDLRSSLQIEMRARQAIVRRERERAFSREVGSFLSQLDRQLVFGAHVRRG